MKRFFCENCSNEVEEKNDVCPHCGAFFTAVKCPECGYRGKLHEFRNGCPKCGYLSDANGEDDTTAGLKIETRSKKPLPSWLFWFILLFLVLSFIVLSRIYVRVT